MLDLLKKVKLFSEDTIGVVIIGLLAVIPLLLNFPNFDSVFFSIGTLFWFLILSFIVVWLAINKRQFVSAVILLINFNYLNGVNFFVNDIVSFDFSSIAHSILLLIGSAWLILVILAHILLKEERRCKRVNLLNEIPLLISFGILYLINGFNGAIFTILVTLLILFLGNKTLSYGFIGAFVLRTIFNNIQTIITFVDFDMIKSLKFDFYFYFVLSVVALVFLIIEIVRTFNLKFQIEDKVYIEE